MRTQGTSSTYRISEFLLRHHERSRGDQMREKLHPERSCLQREALSEEKLRPGRSSIRREVRVDNNWTGDVGIRLIPKYFPVMMKPVITIYNVLHEQRR